MRKFGKFLGRVLMTLIAVIVLLFAFGPREPLDLVPSFDAAILPADLDAYLAAEEAKVPGITPGTEKRIIWAGAPGQQTDYAIVYLHGFSATSEEIRPVPDNVAADLGANLYFTRFAGHGLPGPEMVGPTVQDWVNDTAEALAIGERIGKRVFVIGTSTGGTLAAVAANDPDLDAKMAGIIFVSPNFGVNSIAAPLLTMPLVRYWGSLVAGAERCFTPVNEVHAKFWTTCYPTAALYPMGAVAKWAAKVDYTGVATPALFLYSEADKVVSPAATADVAGQWGGPAVVKVLTVGEGDDPYSHVIAGDALSPGMTDRVTGIMLDWIRAH
jgi:alpha-beta hydrolase superfamily lysophospholipase